jgi:hypothetical protein
MFGNLLDDIAVPGVPGLKEEQHFGRPHWKRGAIAVWVSHNAGDITEPVIELGKE